MASVVWAKCAQTSLRREVLWKDFCERSALEKVSVEKCCGKTFVKEVPVSEVCDSACLLAIETKTLQATPVKKDRRHRVAALTFEMRTN